MLQHVEALQPCAILASAVTAAGLPKLGPGSPTVMHVAEAPRVRVSTAEAPPAPQTGRDGSRCSEEGCTLQGAVHQEWQAAMKAGAAGDSKTVCIVATSGTEGSRQYVALGATSLLHRLACNDEPFPERAVPERPARDALDTPIPTDAATTSAGQMRSQPLLNRQAVVAVTASPAFVDSLWQWLAPVVFGVPHKSKLQSCPCWLFAVGHTVVHKHPRRYPPD